MPWTNFVDELGNGRQKHVIGSLFVGEFLFVRMNEFVDSEVLFDILFAGSTEKFIFAGGIECGPEGRIVQFFGRNRKIPIEKVRFKLKQDSRKIKCILDLRMRS